MTSNKSKKYEFNIVLLLGILFGIVGLDRLVIVYLFPVIIPYFNLSNTQAGSIASVLALTWAVSAWFLGGLSDRIGRKKVLLSSAVFFSVMSWLTGVAGSFTSLLSIRALMGVGEGGVFTSSVATIAAESTPEKKGFNLGLHQSFFPLFGVALGAIITTQLLRFFDWQYVFFIVGIPGLVIAIILFFYMREPEITKTTTVVAEKTNFFEAFNYKNVIISSLVSCTFMTWLYVFSTFVMLFLNQVRHIPLDQAGLTISGWGIGGFVGMILIPSLSDTYGRKPTIIVATILSGLAVLGFVYSGDSLTMSFFWLFISGVLGFGTAPIFLSLCTSEAVPAHLIGSAVGIPTAIGEIFGAVLMPIIAGNIADTYGLKYAILLAGIAPLIGGVIALMYKETAPKVLAKRG